MYKIYFYKDKNEKEPVKDYIQELAAHKDKDSRIKLTKIRDRILFAAWNGESFILLHQFMKQTQKTPPREIETAKRNLASYRERSKDNGNE